MNFILFTIIYLAGLALGFGLGITHEQRRIRKLIAEERKKTQWIVTEFAQRNLHALGMDPFEERISAKELMQ